MLADLLLIVTNPMESVPFFVQKFCEVFTIVARSPEHKWSCKVSVKLIKVSKFQIKVSVIFISIPRARNAIRAISPVVQHLVNSNYL